MKRKALLITGMVLLAVLATALLAGGYAQASDLAAVEAFEALQEQGAEPEDSITLPWWVIGSGGVSGSAGGYTIKSTLGQPIVGEGSSGEPTVTSGFWVRMIDLITEILIYLPVIFK